MRSISTCHMHVADVYSLSATRRLPYHFRQQHAVVPTCRKPQAANSISDSRIAMWGDFSTPTLKFLLLGQCAKTDPWALDYDAAIIDFSMLLLVCRCAFAGILICWNFNFKILLFSAFLSLFFLILQWCFSLLLLLLLLLLLSLLLSTAIMTLDQVSAITCWPHCFDNALPLPLNVMLLQQHVAGGVPFKSRSLDAPPINVCMHWRRFEAGRKMTELTRIDINMQLNGLCLLRLMRQHKSAYLHEAAGNVGFMLPATHFVTFCKSCRAVRVCLVWRLVFSSGELSVPKGKIFRKI